MVRGNFEFLQSFVIHKQTSLLCKLASAKIFDSDSALQLQLAASIFDWLEVPYDPNNVLDHSGDPDIKHDCRPSSHSRGIQALRGSQGDKALGEYGDGHWCSCPGWHGDQFQEKRKQVSALALLNPHQVDGSRRGQGKVERQGQQQ